MKITHDEADGLRGVIRSLAADVHDSWTLSEHLVQAVPDPLQRYRTTCAVARAFGWISHPESGSPHAYLDDLHRVIGTTHLELLAILRQHLADNDPGLDDPRSWRDVMVAREGAGLARQTNRGAAMTNAVLAWNDIKPEEALAPEGILQEVVLGAQRSLRSV